jgi:hypothetical protein
VSHAVEVVDVAIRVDGPQLESNRRQRPALGPGGRRVDNGLTDRKHGCK